MAAWMCYGDTDAECQPWAHYYIFDAKVKKIVAGKLNNTRIRVLFGRHALKKGRHNGVIATLKKLESGKKAEYQILEWGTKKEMYCFSGESNEIYNVRLVENNIDLMCYEKE